MTNMPLHRGAFHEAGHAVMARHLRVNLGRITIDLHDQCGDAHASVGATSAEDRLRIAAAGDACLLAFGVVTSHDQGAFSDEVEIENALSELYDDEASHPQHRADAIADVERLFDQPPIRAAVVALATALMREGEIGGPEAMEIIDRHLA